MIIDIHSHILPEVDDGACDIEMAVEMAKLYLVNDITKVVATPHYVKNSRMNTTYLENKKKLEILKAELQKQKIDLDLYLGNEIYINEYIIEDLNNKVTTTMNESRYILIELPIFDIPSYTDELMIELQNQGYIPIIAHPERNYKIMEDPNILFHLIKKGCLVQVNIPSLEGKYGKESRDTSIILIKNNMCHFIGADSHSCIRRTPNISRGLLELKEMIGLDEYNKITQLNPQKLLNDKDIEITEPIEIKDKKVFKIFLKNLSKATKKERL